MGCLFQEGSQVIAKIGSFAPAWNVQHTNIKHCVGAFDGAVALGEATHLVSVLGCLPEGAVATLAELAVFRNLAGVQIESVAVEGKVVWHGRVTRCVGVSEDVGQGEGGDVLEGRTLRPCAVGNAMWGSRPGRGRSGEELMGMDDLRGFDGLCGGAVPACCEAATPAAGAGTIVECGSHGSCRQLPKRHSFGEAGKGNGQACWWSKWEHPQMCVQRGCGRILYYGRRCAGGRSTHPQKWICCGSRVKWGCSCVRHGERAPGRRYRCQDGRQLRPRVSVTGIHRRQG